MMEWYYDGVFSGGADFGLELVAVLKLLCAVVLGALIGIERSIAKKHVGMRTYALVSLGACLFTVAGELIGGNYLGLTGFDPSRIAAAVVMGIGFIGTGLVVMRDSSHPVGLTTAAGVWVAAGVGVAVAFSLYLLAIAATALSLIILRSFASIEGRIEEKLG